MIGGFKVCLLSCGFLNVAFDLLLGWIRDAQTKITHNFRVVYSGVRAVRVDY